MFNLKYKNMKKLKCFFILFFSIITTSIIFAQPQPQNSSHTFTVEINADNTFEELEEIQRFLKEDYNVSIHFTDVNIKDDKIYGIKLTLKNENQSLMKSVQNNFKPIDAFQIVLKQINDKKYHIAINDDKQSHTSDFGFSTLSKDMLSSPFDTDFHFDFMDEQINKMRNEILKSQERFRSFFHSSPEESKPNKDIEGLNNSQTLSQSSSFRI